MLLILNYLSAHYQTVSWKSVFLTLLIIHPMSRYKITQPSILVFFTLSIFHPMPKYKDTNPSNLGSLCRPVYAQGLTKHCVDLACNLFNHEQGAMFNHQLLSWKSPLPALLQETLPFLFCKCSYKTYILILVVAR